MRRIRMRRMALVALARHYGPPLYCQVNKKVPLLTMYFDGHSDLRPDFRLNRDTISGLIGQLWATDHHDWAKHLDTLVFLFWLASGTSYRVVARAFDMPKATVCDVVHRVAETILALRRRVINFPSLDGLAEVSAGFQKLGGSAAFRKVVGGIDGCHVRIKPPGDVGGIDGCHVRIKPPGENAECYFNRKLFHSVPGSVRP
ncbi:uncharacterized protein LOC121640497 isoform X2 [Melanotaenia boesemani]|uniref:uncharacterized protein LOC121640497 isoform X2 n=1 Tax=Melanotaenia boesemani TaxID=1250792 RepID=UPI001C055849|nr:uncharacterized protein LOC121640497 isoform X2 [Melanotaenia boesemani]